MTTKTVKWKAFLFTYMSDNTQPPDRAFRGPNTAVTSYVNTVHRGSKFPQNTV